MILNISSATNDKPETGLPRPKGDFDFSNLDDDALRALDKQLSQLERTQGGRHDSSQSGQDAHGPSYHVPGYDTERVLYMPFEADEAALKTVFRKSANERQGHSARQRPPRKTRSDAQLLRDRLDLEKTDPSMRSEIAMQPVMRTHRVSDTCGAHLAMPMKERRNGVSYPERRGSRTLLKSQSAGVHRHVSLSLSNKTPYSRGDSSGVDSHPGDAAALALFPSVDEEEPLSPSDDGANDAREECGDPSAAPNGEDGPASASKEGAAHDARGPGPNGAGPANGPPSHPLSPSANDETGPRLPVSYRCPPLESLLLSTGDGQGRAAEDDRRPTFPRDSRPSGGSSAGRGSMEDGRGGGGKDLSNDSRRTMQAPRGAAHARRVQSMPMAGNRDMAHASKAHLRASLRTSRKAAQRVSSEQLCIDAAARAHALLQRKASGGCDGGGSSRAAPTQDIKARARAAFLAQKRSGAVDAFEPSSPTAGDLELASSRCMRLNLTLTGSPYRQLHRSGASGVEQHSPYGRSSVDDLVSHFHSPGAGPAAKQ